jgi:hypothetical protein
MRQPVVVLASGDRTNRLRNLHVPTLVISLELMPDVVVIPMLPGTVDSPRPWTGEQSREGCQSAADDQKARQGDLTPCHS